MFRGDYESEKGARMRYGGIRGGGWEVRDAARDRDPLGGSFMIDARGTIVGFDGAMERLTGWTAAEVVGRGGPSPILVQTPPADGARHETIDLTLRCRDGSLVEIEAALTRGESGVETATVTVLRVTARGDDGRALPLAGRDTLTGLAGRERFFERLGTEIRAAAGGGRTLAVIVADVDHLRKVADQHGPEAAATALRKLAGILRATVRDEDLVARLEVDDFALILPGLGRGSARQIAARIRSIVERSRFSPAGLEASIGVTLSIGAASYPTDADNETDLLARAREALDEARSLGRNRVWCYTRRPRVPLRTPVYLDGATPLLLGYSHDLSPSGLFVSTPAPIGVGMRCALSFPLPNADGKVHVIGRVVRTVPLADPGAHEPRLAGMGVEFERFGPEDRRAIESYLFVNESQTLRPEGPIFSV
jgi:diguanylate cyclase (GGDEF)-like protein